MTFQHLRCGLASVFAVIVGASVAMAHNHLTVDTTAVIGGRQIVIHAGYYPTERQYTIEGGRLMNSGALAVYPVADALVQADGYGGWFASDALLLTSDYFFATGRLDGGDFRYELSSVVPVAARGAAGPMLAWGDFDESFVFVPSALSDGATREGRSFAVGLAGHDHEQGFAFSTPGLYDVTLVGWDANGVYLDSAPVTVRFRVGVIGAGCNPADLTGAGGTFGGGSVDVAPDQQLTIEDFLSFLSAFGDGTGCPGAPGAGACNPADITGSGGTYSGGTADVPSDGELTIEDFLVFLAAFGDGCGG